MIKRRIASVGVFVVFTLPTVASTTSAATPPGTVVETSCECVTNINGTWDYLGGTGDTVDGIVTLTLHATASDEVTGTEVGEASAHPGFHATVTGYISHGHLYIYVAGYAVGKYFVQKSEWWTTGLVPSSGAAGCAPEIDADPLSLSTYGSNYSELFFSVADFQNAKQGATPHLGVNPGVFCSGHAAAPTAAPPATVPTTETVDTASVRGLALLSWHQPAGYPYWQVAWSPYAEQLSCQDSIEQTGLDAFSAVVEHEAGSSTTPEQMGFFPGTANTPADWTEESGSVTLPAWFGAAGTYVLQADANCALNVTITARKAA
jgi:hypothetical protein